MITWCFNYRRILCQDLFLMQEFLKPYNHIAHHFCVVHDVVFHGEIGVFLEFLVCCPKTLFETNPLPLDCFCAIPFPNRQSELTRPLKNDFSYVHILVLSVRRSSDVIEHDRLFNDVE